MIKFYSYKKCSTCQKAKKFLKEHDLKFEEIDITTNPPNIEVLQKILESGKYNIKELFNRSGVMYREMNMKEKIDHLSQENLLELLSKNGKLVKRPIATDMKNHTVGFKEEIYQDIWIP